ncbi:hypothetical protein AAFF_G00098430 [Aldrovandia affinis]|uniref:Uncharacterized protein n=1 Tax=Aldrovandia affinis TaxID=143900 RepID=A0AAD7RV94_9TELE|nr:hypothetical protein AAFF_G00098430 [Aldrovandia affinis]
MSLAGPLALSKVRNGEVGPRTEDRTKPERREPEGKLGSGAWPQHAPVCTNVICCCSNSRNAAVTPNQWAQVDRVTAGESRPPLPLESAEPEGTVTVRVPVNRGSSSGSLYRIRQRRSGVCNAQHREAMTSGDTLGRTCPHTIKPRIRMGTCSAQLKKRARNADLPTRNGKWIVEKKHVKMRSERRASSARDIRSGLYKGVAAADFFPSTFQNDTR